MTFKDQMAGDVAAVFLRDGEFAETITYTPPGGAAVTRRAAWIPDPPVTEQDEARRARIREGDLWVSADPDEGLSSPRVDATVTIAGDDFKVAAVGETEEGAILLRLRRVETLEHGRARMPG